MHVVVFCNMHSTIVVEFVSVCHFIEKKKTENIQFATSIIVCKLNNYLQTK